MKILARKTIRDLKPYEPGKPIDELQRELSIRAKDIIKIASNENPLGPSPKAIKAICEAIKTINRYPEGSCFYLKKRLAQKLKLKPYNLLFGNGSDEIIDIIAKTFLEEDEEAIISKPSFLEYRIIVKTRGAGLKTIPMDKTVCGFEYNIDKILNAIGPKTKLILLGSPDNPTGAYLSRRGLAYLLKRCPKRVIVVIDEAYREFVDVKDYADSTGYINRGNLILLRTFSKAYGLAGLRIGYCITNKMLCSWMERARQPFNVNIPAQIGALAALDDRAHLAKSKRLIKQGKKFISRELKRLGLEVIESPANFMLFSCKGIKGAAIFKKLLSKGIIIRSMKAYGLERWARVNVGTMPENRKFIEALKKVPGVVK